MTQIAFYYNYSDNKVVDKQLQLLYTVNGDFKTPWDPLNPVFFVDNTSGTFSLTYPPNYCKFGLNYYYINNWKLATKDYIEIDAHIDVLMTFKDSIRSCFAVISRQEYVYNAYLNDPLVQTLQKPNVSTQAMGGQSLTPTFCLVTTGGGSSGSGGGSSE